MISRFRVADHSMEPALQSGDIIICRRTRRPHRGSVVVFPHPRTRMTLVKRVVGLPGEKVAIDFGEVIIDGRDGVDLWGTGTTFPEGEWHLGPKEWFLLSDNRSATVDDSRGFGPVTLGGPPTMFWRMRLRGDR